MKKVLQVVTVPLGYDGISAFVRRIVSAMDKTEIQVDVLAINDPEAAISAAFREMGVRVHVIKGRLKNPVSYMMRLAQLVRRERYDAVHVHGNSCTMAFDLMGAYLGGARMRAAHSHNTFCNFMAAHRALRPMFDALYTHAFACGEEAGKWLFGKKPFAVVPNAVDADRFAFDPRMREKARRELGAGDSLLIGAVAHFSPQKNHSFMLEAFARFLKIDPTAKLMLVGDGPLRGEIEVAINRLGIKNSVTLLGVRDDVPYLQQAFDVMLLPSLYEGFPTVLLEWQAAGLPAIVSDTVTRAAALTPLVQFVSISSDPDPWADALIHINPRIDRNTQSTSAIVALKAGGYTLKEVAEGLARGYEAGGSAHGR